MTGITIPDTVTRIEDAAFTGSGLTSVTVPESVTEFGEDVFFSVYEADGGIAAEKSEVHTERNLQ